MLVSSFQAEPTGYMQPRTAHSEGLGREPRSPKSSRTLAALLISSLCLVGLCCRQGWRRDRGGGRHHSLPSLTAGPGHGGKRTFLTPPPSDGEHVLLFALGMFLLPLDRPGFLCCVNRLRNGGGDEFRAMQRSTR